MTAEINADQPMNWTLAALQLQERQLERIAASAPCDTQREIEHYIETQARVALVRCYLRRAHREHLIATAKNHEERAQVLASPLPYFHTMDAKRREGVA